MDSSSMDNCTQIEITYEYKKQNFLLVKHIQTRCTKNLTTIKQNLIGSFYYYFTHWTIFYYLYARPFALLVDHQSLFQVFLPSQ